MKVQKVINNNVVSAIDKNGKEHVLMGKGIGFQRKKGDFVENKEIEKHFSLNKENISGEIEDLEEHLPAEYMQVAGDFMAYVGRQFKVEIDYGICVSIAYHIFEACKRVKEGHVLKNELLLDTMNSYPKEFALASRALKMVEEQLGYTLPSDEAGFIAIHLVNLHLQEEQQKDRIREFTDRVLSIIEEECKITLSGESATYERFVNHLHYLGRKLYEDHGFGETEEDEFYRQVAGKYKKARECVEVILSYIMDETQISLPDDEIMYLTIYVQRILLEQDN